MAKRADKGAWVAAPHPCLRREREYMGMTATASLSQEECVWAHPYHHSPSPADEGVRLGMTALLSLFHSGKGVYMASTRQGMTRGDKGIQVVTRGDKGAWVRVPFHFTEGKEDIWE